MTSKPDTDAVFVGSVPEIYDKYLVPLIFESYADDLAARLPSLTRGRVLELAAGTGVVTRALARSLPVSVEVVGSDLNQDMLDRAAAIGTSREVSWRLADALELPFDDGSFDAVLCQFGVMFFPDKVRAYGEAHRVLRRGGPFIFNTWDCIEENEFADVVTGAVGTLFPDDPPRFLARTPHGYFDEEEIRHHLALGGFDAVEIEPLEARSRAALAGDPAIAYCHGTPLRDEIEARDPSRLGEAAEVATAAIERRFGATEVDGRIRGYVVTAKR
ncbi:MAG: class I SAM-dependent methyltransferase [Thermoanaerobaculia bacterium]